MISGNEARPGDVFGLVKPMLDAHTIGVFEVARLLDECGYRAVVADEAICRAIEQPSSDNDLDRLLAWLRDHSIAHLGFSYRLDPDNAVALFCRLIDRLRQRRVLAEDGGRTRGLFFAGLPAAGEAIARIFGERVGVFFGDETPMQTLLKLGIPQRRIPTRMAGEVAYDESRLQFGRELIAKGDYRSERPPTRFGYPGFGTRDDRLSKRLEDAGRRGLLPLTRCHVGPYLADPKEAVSQFLCWCRELAQSGFLDILSIGTSQLSQSHFGQPWGDRPNGGGVPVRTEADLDAIYAASRPMLVRTYAGTRNIPALASIYEERLNIAWHALSIWWFNKLDGRGPLTLPQSIEQHMQTLRRIAATGKPFEANIPHHFAFRGADDLTYVVSGVLGARLAKHLGIRVHVLQNMLNTPKSTWGIQDLAKARALLRLVRELQDDRFRVVYQPRAGLDYFSSSLDRAQAQLAASTALMDDVEPDDPNSPAIIHVVSYSEARFLATPPIVDESIQIAHHALKRYRAAKRSGSVARIDDNPELATRTETLVSGAQRLLSAIEHCIPSYLSARGLHQVFAAGFLPVPYLWKGRDAYPEAARWTTRLMRGAMVTVDADGKPVAADTRAALSSAAARALASVLPE